MATRSSSSPSEVVPWDALRTDFLEKFEPGQHLAVIGPTGSGKTTFAVNILEAFFDLGASEVMLANKGRDPLLRHLESGGWARISAWPPNFEERQKRKILLWPPYGRASQAKANAHIFVNALDYILMEGGWVVYIDEVRYFIEQLGMRSLVDEYWNGARSADITVVAGSQGTTWINKTMIRQESWLILFKPRSIDESKEYADAAGDRDVAADLDALGPHEFLMIHTPDGRRYRSSLSVPSSR